MSKLIVAFDLCDTLVKGNTTFIFLDHFLKNNTLYTIFRRFSRLLPIKIIFKILALAKIDLNRKIALLFLRGISREELQCNANYLVENEFTYEKNIVALIELFHNRNIPVFIISASLDIIVQSVAKKFAINYLSSELQFDNNICTGKLEKDLLYTKSEYMNTSSGSYPFIYYDNLLFVSDNIQDVQILKKAKFGFGYYTDKNKKAFSLEKIEKFEINRILSLIDNPNF